jgi:opacity protein-like surface antigen
MMKRFIAALALMALAAPAVAKDVTIGLSWDARESALNQAWEDYMRAEGTVKLSNRWMEGWQCF